MGTSLDRLKSSLQQRRPMVYGFFSFTGVYKEQKKESPCRGPLLRDHATTLRHNFLGGSENTELSTEASG